jgi:hypothetical protein
MEELVNITIAAKTDAEVEVLYNKFNIADEIDLSDPMVVNGLEMLVNKNLLTSERKASILSGE